MVGTDWFGSNRRTASAGSATIAAAMPEISRQPRRSPITPPLFGRALRGMRKDNPDRRDQAIRVPNLRLT